MAQGFPSEAIHHALAAGDAKCCAISLLNHAWGMFNHSELGLLEQLSRRRCHGPICWKIRA
ncbi:hypothetical protein MJ579_26705 [Klebsiella pneumoniae]|nr:hypothetical protein MJ579_26705 [Klebsiella pneumoniae]